MTKKLYYGKTIIWKKPYYGKTILWKIYIMEKTLFWENYSMEKTMVLCLILWSFDLLWKNYGTIVNHS